MDLTKASVHDVNVLKERKRIETLFPQLCGQMMLKRNYAKSLEGLITRLITKIAAVTILQSMNYTNNKPINHLKHALLPNRTTG